MRARPLQLAKPPAITKTDTSVAGGGRTGPLLFDDEIISNSSVSILGGESSSSSDNDDSSSDEESNAGELEELRRPSVQAMIDKMLTEPPLPLAKATEKAAIDLLGPQGPTKSTDLLALSPVATPGSRHPSLIAAAMELPAPGMLADLAAAAAAAGSSGGGAAEEVEAPSPPPTLRAPTGHNLQDEGEEVTSRL